MNRRAIFTSAALRLNLAKSSGYFLAVAVFKFGLGSTAAYALDGTRSPANIAPAIGRVAPQAPAHSGNLREWFRARQLGDVEAARKLLEDAARGGDVGAAWELGRMYADGDGVKQNHQLGFEYFSGIADSHADEPTGTAQARFVANAFVRLASYYLTGIPSSNIKPDAVRARDMFNYAASYFGDRDAQYRLGRMYLDGQGVGKDTKQGIRWLSLAADKGQYQAQAVFGALLFKGQYLARDAAGGLMYLILARDAATVEETWITDVYTAASKQATAEEVTRALDHVKRWIEHSRSGRREHF
jgi:TPR repeat protein